MLVGKKGIAMVGDSYGQSFDDFAASRLALTRVTTSEQAFDMVRNGQADNFAPGLCEIVDLGQGGFSVPGISGSH